MAFPVFYPILDSGLIARLGLPLAETARTLLDAGVKILQLRHKGSFTREVFAEAERIGELCRDAGAIFIVNDRADMARILEVGVHLGQQDLAPVDARKVLLPGAVCGFSTHNERQLRSALSQPVDYLALGPVFSTVSKENPDPALGVEELRRLRPLCDVPLVAIGGITRANVAAVLEAGADAVAVIGDLFPEANPAVIRARAEGWLRLTSQLRSTPPA